MHTKRTINFFGKTLCGSLVVLLIITWLFGVEPQLWMSSGTHYMRDMSFQEYMLGSVAQNGDTTFTRVVTTLVYPGAKVGRLLHNAFID